MAKNTVLIADNEDLVRTNLTNTLEREGFDVISCADGRAALEVLKSSAIDALITELRLPGVCGLDLIDYSRELAPDAGIVVITAIGDLRTANDAMNKGVQEYFRKPLIHDEFVFTLKRVLAHGEIAKQNRVLCDVKINKKQFLIPNF